ncbi:hypothetical protein D3C81_2331660 [compost metagenome]
MDGVYLEVLKFFLSSDVDHACRWSGGRLKAWREVDDRLVRVLFGEPVSVIDTIDNPDVEALAL